MQIKQFYDKDLAHASYAIVSEGEIALIDPARDPSQYFDFAKEQNSKIAAIIETHLHADFVSSHVEIAKKTGAKIYISKVAKVEYDHCSFDEGETIPIGNVKLVSVNTPGHSPDSISILLVDKDEKINALFTGDTLFVGDVGRPDLREGDGNSKETLAEALYDSLHKKILKLPESTHVYPAHGPGSLCGKNLGPDLNSTIGKEKKTNFILSLPDKSNFIKNLLQDQPFVPGYFSYNVMLNKRGSSGFEESISKVKIIEGIKELKSNFLIIDIRPAALFQSGHISGAVNLQLEKSFTTWLGTIVAPEEKFYLTGENQNALTSAIEKAAKIGYEKNIVEAFVSSTDALRSSGHLNKELFKKSAEKFTIVDVRTSEENNQQKFFGHAINIPLQELRKRIQEIPTDKPIVVHCAGGTRSAIASSILQKELSSEVFDLGESIKNYQAVNH